MSAHELATFLTTWDMEAKSTERLLKSLPADKYDFRPDAGGRSLGELAWHLPEAEGFMADAVIRGAFDFTKKIPGLERPKTIAELAPGYVRVHDEWFAKVKALSPDALDRSIPFMGRDMRAGDVLWTMLLHHGIHHRGQLSLMVRLAGGVAPGMYGPNREDMAAMRGA